MPSTLDAFIYYILNKGITSCEGHRFFSANQMVITNDLCVMGTYFLGLTLVSPTDRMQGKKQMHYSLLYLCFTDRVYDIFSLYLNYNQ